MSEQKNTAVITLLANDALEAAGDKSVLACLLLIDAALVLVVTRLGRAGALEMAGMLASYVVEQIDVATRKKGDAQR